MSSAVIRSNREDRATRDALAAQPRPAPIGRVQFGNRMPVAIGSARSVTTQHQTTQHQTTPYQTTLMSTFQVREKVMRIPGICLAVAILFVVSCAFAQEHRVEDVEFISRGDTLAGTLVFPAEGNVRAAVVFVHGSGKQTRNLSIAERFAANGIAALVYDKRGAGASGGRYDGEQSVSGQNIAILAEDAVAALDVLSAHPALKAVPLGLTGISQAGWIVPLAAESSARVDFMVLWSGPVCRVSEEDIYSKYTNDVDAASVPGYEEALMSRKTPYLWPDFLGKDTDPSENLAALRIPGLWIFGASDGSIPVDLSIRRLERLIADGGKYGHVLVPDQGHNNMAGTFSIAVDWINALAKASTETVD